MSTSADPNASRARTVCCAGSRAVLIAVAGAVLLFVIFNEATGGTSQPTPQSAVDTDGSAPAAPPPATLRDTAPLTPEPRPPDPPSALPARLRPRPGFSELSFDGSWQPTVCLDPHRDGCEFYSHGRFDPPLNASHIRADARRLLRVRKPPAACGNTGNVGNGSAAARWTSDSARRCPRSALEAEALAGFRWAGTGADARLAHAACALPDVGTRRDVLAAWTAAAMRAGQPHALLHFRGDSRHRNFGGRLVSILRHQRRHIDRQSHFRTTYVATTHGDAFLFGTDPFVLATDDPAFRAKLAPGEEVLLELTIIMQWGEHNVVKRTQVPTPFPPPHRTTALFCGTQWGDRSVAPPRHHVARFLWRVAAFVAALGPGQVVFLSTAAVRLDTDALTPFLERAAKRNRAFRLFRDALRAFPARPPFSVLAPPSRTDANANTKDESEESDRVALPAMRLTLLDENAVARLAHRGGPAVRASVPWDGDAMHWHWSCVLKPSVGIRHPPHFLDGIATPCHDNFNRALHSLAAAYVSGAATEPTPEAGVDAQKRLGAVFDAARNGARAPPPDAPLRAGATTATPADPGSDGGGVDPAALFAALLAGEVGVGQPAPNGDDDDVGVAYSADDGGGVAWGRPGTDACAGWAGLLPSVANAVGAAAVADVQRRVPGCPNVAALDAATVSAAAKAHTRVDGNATNATSVFAACSRACYMLAVRLAAFANEVWRASRPLPRC